MFEIAWPWVWWLALLPLLVRWFLKPMATRNKSALRIVPSFLNDFLTESSEKKSELQLSKKHLLLLAILAWLLLVFAASRPQWIEEINEMPFSGRDLMLAIDISGSMQTEDFSLGQRRASRWNAARAVAREFIKQRQGDRIGLIVFGSEPYLQMPLSFDLETVQDMLDSTYIGLAGVQSTAIGDAIGLAVKRLREYEKSNKVLILLTDGANNAGHLSPDEAANIAAKEGMKIYTIGVGSNRRMGFFSQGSELDERSLQKIAKSTGGKYYRAQSTNELLKIYQVLNQLEAIERETKIVRIPSELYPWPLAAALLIGFALLLGYTLQGRMRWSF